MIVSTRTLNLLAAAVWYIGGVVLLLKSSSLLLEAYALRPQALWIWGAILSGVAIGGLKARFLFTKSCRKNLTRIAALKKPQIWQFFRPGFFLFLALMITLGATLSNMAHHNYPFLCAVAALDLTIATALLGSSYIFWREQAFSA